MNSKVSQNFLKKTIPKKSWKAWINYTKLKKNCEKLILRHLISRVFWSLGTALGKEGPFYICHRTVTPLDQICRLGRDWSASVLIPHTTTNYNLLCIIVTTVITTSFISVKSTENIDSKCWLCLASLLRQIWWHNKSIINK